MKNLKRIEDILRYEGTFDSVYNMVAFWDLCTKVDIYLSEGKDFTVPYYLVYAKCVSFRRHKTADVPKDAQRLTFYGKKYYVYEQ